MHYARRAFVLGALTLAFAGCVTPQIPLPPPVLGSIGLEVVDDSRDLVRLVATAGGVPAGSTVIIHITDDASGCDALALCTIAFVANNSDGSFTSPTFIASDKAKLEIEYRRPDGSDSESLCVNVDLAEAKNLRKCQ